jgi:hypothetical protein
MCLMVHWILSLVSYKIYFKLAGQFFALPVFFILNQVQGKNDEETSSQVTK